MPFGNIGSAPNNNQKQLHHTIGLSDPKTVIVYYNLALLQMCELLWFRITGTVALKSVTGFVVSLINLI